MYKIPESRLRRKKLEVACYDKMVKYMTWTPAVFVFCLAINNIWCYFVLFLVLTYKFNDFIKVLNTSIKYLDKEINGKD